MPHSGPLFSLQVMYFSSLFPYVVLACFLVRGLLLRGAIDGILHMFTPKVRVAGSWGTWTALLGLICSVQCNNPLRACWVAGSVSVAGRRHGLEGSTGPACTAPRRETASQYG